MAVGMVISVGVVVCVEVIVVVETLGAVVVCYLPLPMEGNATDLSFFSSARARQFFTVLSSSSSHLSEPQPGLLQWITNFAGRP